MSPQDAAVTLVQALEERGMLPARRPEPKPRRRHGCELWGIPRVRCGGPMPPRTWLRTTCAGGRKKHEGSEFAATRIPHERLFTLWSEDPQPRTVYRAFAGGPLSRASSRQVPLAAILDWR